MEEPKYVVCLQGVDGFVADYGNLELAIARAKVLCPPGGEAYVLAPVKTIRRTVAGILSTKEPVIEETEAERMVAHPDVLKRIATDHKRAGKR